MAHGLSRHQRLNAGLALCQCQLRRLPCTALSSDIRRAQPRILHRAQRNLCFSSSCASRQSCGILLTLLLPPPAPPPPPPPPAGHSESVLTVNFSPDGKYLASGAGDTTVRMWDLNTQLPKHECKGHRNWVLVVAWSPDAKYIASGDMDGNIWLWNPETGKPYGQCVGHRKWITSLVRGPPLRTWLQHAPCTCRLHRCA
jgi:hypothetical protein